jgi:hypothetical protein
VVIADRSPIGLFKHPPLVRTHGDFIPALRAFGPVLPIPSFARLVTLPPTNDHSVIVPSAFLTSSFIDECGFTNLKALNAPATFASFPNAYTPARE